MDDLKKIAAEQDFLVTARDALSVGLCANGQRDWLVPKDFDFRDFVRNGMSARVLLSFDDAQVNRAVRAAWERTNGR